jgi:hypothetical protein
MVTMLKMRSFAYNLTVKTMEHGVNFSEIEHQVLNVIQIIPMVIVDLEIITTIMQNKKQFKLKNYTHKSKNNQSLETRNIIPPIP